MTRQKQPLVLTVMPVICTVNCSRKKAVLCESHENHMKDHNMDKNLVEHEMGKVSTIFRRKHIPRTVFATAIYRTNHRHYSQNPGLFLSGHFSSTNCDQIRQIFF